MTHVSSRKLEKDFLEKLFSKLVSTLGKAQTRNSLTSVTNELLTPTEKIMFAKRLAIVLLLSSKTPQHKIVDLLKVSPTTVAKASLGIEIGKYKNILKISSQEKIDLEKIIWTILTAGGFMPPKVGRKRWSKISKM